MASAWPLVILVVPQLSWHLARWLCGLICEQHGFSTMGVCFKNRRQWTEDTEAAVTMNPETGSGKVLWGLVRRMPLLPFEPHARAWPFPSSPFLSESNLPAPDATPAASAHRWRYPQLHRWGAAPSQAGWSGSEGFRAQLCPEPAA